MLRAILQTTKQRLNIPLAIDNKTVLKRESRTVTQVRRWPKPWVLVS